MPIMFNTVLQEAGFSMTDVRLLRHQDNRADKGRSPYELWRDDRTKFDLYQSHQKIGRRSAFVDSSGKAYWASFVGTSDTETLFVGIYAISYRGVLEQDIPMPHTDGIDKAGSCDVYDLVLQEALRDLIGKLYVEWGTGYRTWVQRADRQNKAIIEFRRQFQEPESRSLRTVVIRDSLPVTAATRCRPWNKESQSGWTST